MTDLNEVTALEANEVGAQRNAGTQPDESSPPLKAEQEVKNRGEKNVQQSNQDQSTHESTGQAGPERPADDDILLQENSIKAEEAQKMEFIGDLVTVQPLVVLHI